MKYNTNKLLKKTDINIYMYYLIFIYGGERTGRIYMEGERD